MGRFEVQDFRGHEEGKYLCLFTGRKKSSIVSDHFTPSQSLNSVSQHCTGWQSAACVHRALYLEYHHSYGHSGYLPPLLKPEYVPECACHQVSNNGVVSPEAFYLMLYICANILPHPVMPHGIRLKQRVSLWVSVGCTTVRSGLGRCF